jgi:hypothetical protein
MFKLWRKDLEKEEEREPCFSLTKVYAIARMKRTNLSFAPQCDLLLMANFADCRLTELHMSSMI